MADVKHFHLPLLFQHAVYRAINMGFVTIKEVSKLAVFRCYRASIRVLFEAEYRLAKSPIPYQPCTRLSGLDLYITD